LESIENKKERSMKREERREKREERREKGDVKCFSLKSC
jgi:hypothetical protein